jgi:hypothetical protein
MKRKQKQKKQRLPKEGDKIYVGTSWYLSHGEDDFEGGIATITKVEVNEKCENPYNRIMVGIKENPGSMHNYTYLMENQAKWKKQFGKQKAHPDPDYSPSSNDDGGWSVGVGIGNWP